MTNPWCSPDIARMMAENVDRQLAERPPPIHFTAYADAVRSAVIAGGRTLLEAGCGVGHSIDILDRSGVHGYSFTGFKFTGVDISEPAIALARARHADASWHVADAATLANFERHDIVVDGSLVLHVEDWRAHLAALCAASRDAVILHRMPIGHFGKDVAAFRQPTFGYGREFPAWSFALDAVTAEMSAHGFAHTETRKADGDSLTLTFRKGA